MMNILYFLEDRAQEGFVKSLVARVAGEEGIKVNSIVRTARGGKPKALKEFRRFIKDLLRGSQSVPDLLIVAIDGNCDVNKVHREIRKSVTGTPFETCLICCIPDPHIERWYLLDQSALRKAVGSNILTSLLEYKCKKEFYKEKLRNAVRPVGSLLGGSEYGENIASNLNYDILERNDKSFDKFVQDLRTRFRSGKSNP